MRVRRVSQARRRSSALPVRRDEEPPPRAFYVGRRQSLPTSVALPPIAAGNQASPPPSRDAHAVVLSAHGSVLHDLGLPAAKLSRTPSLRELAFGRVRTRQVAHRRADDLQKSPPTVELADDLIWNF